MFVQKCVCVCARMSGGESKKEEQVKSTKSLGFHFE